VVVLAPVLLLPAVLLFQAAATPGSDSSGAGGIFSCKNAKGVMITGDRELTGCVGEQTERNRDGSFRRIVPKPMTEDEKAAEDEKRRRLEREATEKRIEQRKDEGLLRLYPDTAALEKARQQALAPMVTAIRLSDERNDDLLKTRQRLIDEAEFYPDKRKMPAKLKRDIDANDAALAAEKQAQQNRQDELKRINGNFDTILARLKILWARQSASSR
jgi:hypothetical protein